MRCIEYASVAVLVIALDTPHRGVYRVSDEPAYGL